MSSGLGVPRSVLGLDGRLGTARTTSAATGFAQGQVFSTVVVPKVTAGVTY